uniref:Integrase catalytic domain-containing protein n=1 Tax=Fagus sylvatica TaxID=28930 RepID=A0A2N9ER43_FAGSY
MEEPEQGNSAQNCRDLKAYQSWRKKDRCARFTMLSSMHNDLIGEFESYDTGATDHVARDRVGFVEYCRVPAGSRWMRMGNESRVEVLGIGTYKLQLRHGRTLLLHDVLYAPRMRQNLLSVNVLLELGFSFGFHGRSVDIFLGSTCFGHAFISDDRLFHLDIDCSAYDSSFALLTQNDHDEMNWHARLGHIGQDRMTRLAREGLLGPLAKVNLPTCEHCLAGKSTRKPFGKGIRATVPLKLIHSDLVSHKSEALDCFRQFMNLVENQMERTIKTLRTDRGREYLSEQFRELCENKGIRRQLTIPRTPQQNGVAERRNRTLLDMVTSTILPTNMENWALEQINVYLSRYSDESKGYVMLGEHPDGGVTEIVSRDVEFMENDFPSRGDVGQSLELYEMRGNVPRRRFGIEGESFISAAQDDTEPRSYDEAMSSPACNEWMTAMKDEMESMRTNQVWELVDLPPGRKSIGNKWVLKIKRKADAMVASLDLELHQMDVKTAFLNGELDEEIFMDQPIGFVVKGQERKRNHCVYVKRSEGSFIILSLYVDDILLAGNDKEFIKTIKEWLPSTFEMKDMGEASFVLGDCKPIDTPVGKGNSLSSEMCPKTWVEIESMARVPYANAIGSLMYAMLCTRPDICFVVGLVNRFQSNPGPAHWKAVKRILRYLRGTADYMLCYQGRDLRLRGYSDADWAGDLDERKSTSSYTFLLAAVQEAIWLRRFLQRLDIVASAMDPVTIYSDNMATLAYAKDPKYHGKTKHIEIKYHYIRDMVAKKEVGSLTRATAFDAWVAGEDETWYSLTLRETLKESGLMKNSSQALGATGLRSVQWKYQDAFMTYAPLKMEEKSTATCDHTTCARNDHKIGRQRLGDYFFGMLPIAMDYSALRDMTGRSVEPKLSGIRAKGRQSDNTSQSSACVRNSC